jgi:acyl-CoA synthetase (AMP-forming)/AMP-acid ligase II
MELYGAVEARRRVRKAIVSLKEGWIATEREINDFCKDHLANYKKPKSVEFMKDTPRNSYGKTLKRELRAKYRTGEARMVR